MNAKHKSNGLGQGLERLLGSTPIDNVKFPAEGGLPHEQLMGIPIQAPIDEVSPNPDQPRKYFQQATIDSLAESIRLKGIIEPLVVRKKEQGFELIAGHRRLQAARKAGLKTVPVIIMDIADHGSDRLMLALIENIQREDLNAIEEAESFKRLSDEFSCNDIDIGKLLGKDRTTIINAKRLLDLPEEIQDDIRFKRLSAGHGQAILRIADRSKWADARRIILSDNLSVRKAEALAKKFNRESKKSEDDNNLDDIDKRTAYYESLEKKFTDTLGGLKVKIHYSGKIKKIEIHYVSNEDMEGIMEKFGIE